MRRASSVLFILLLIGAAGCAAQPAELAEATRAPAGFFLGLWHGMIVWFTFIVSLFNDNVAVYEAVNTGHFYDLGFVLGVGGSAGGGASGVSRRRSSDD